MALLLARALPSATLHEIFWRMPYCTAGFLVMQLMRSLGVKGISRPEEDAALWAEFQNMSRSK